MTEPEPGESFASALPARAPRRAPAEAVDRLPPHSLEAERGVLGCCLMSPMEALNGVRESFGTVVIPEPPESLAKPGRRKPPVGMETALYDVGHQTLLRCLFDMDGEGKPIDLITVGQRLRDLGKLEELGGLAWLSGLLDAVPSVANLPWYAGIVVEKWRLRLTLQACVHTIAWVGEAEGEVDEIVRGLQSTVLTLTEQRARDRLAHVRVGVKEILGTAENAFKHRNQGLVAEFPTGLSFLDKRITGLHKRQVFYLGGMQSSGKTSLILTMIAHQAIKCGIKVGFLSIESARQEVVLRLVCNVSGANYRQIHSGMISGTDMARIQEWAPKITEAPLWMDDTNGMTPLDVRMAARRMVQQSGIEVLYIDHLHRIRVPEARGDAIEAIRQSVDAVRWCARELNLAVVCAAQLNREAKKETRGGRGSRRVEATDFRGASELEEDADTMGILQADPEGEEDCQPEDEVWPMNFQIVKQRNGPPGPVKLTFKRSLYRYEDRYLGTGSVSKGEAKREQQDTWEDEK